LISLRLQSSESVKCCLDRLCTCCLWLEIVFV
jgi:hypothetical protein